MLGLWGKPKQAVRSARILVLGEFNLQGDVEQKDDLFTYDKFVQLERC